MHLADAPEVAVRLQPARHRDVRLDDRQLVPSLFILGARDHLRDAPYRLLCWSDAMAVQRSVTSHAGKHLAGFSTALLTPWGTTLRSDRILLKKRIDRDDALALENVVPLDQIGRYIFFVGTDDEEVSQVVAAEDDATRAR